MALTDEFFSQHFGLKHQTIGQKARAEEAYIRPGGGLVLGQDPSTQVDSVEMTLGREGGS